MIHGVMDFIKLPRPPVSSHISTHVPKCTHTCTNIYMDQHVHIHVPTYTCTRTSTYTCTRTNIHMHQHILTGTRTIIYIYAYQYHAYQPRHTRTIKFCLYMVSECCHDIHTRMLSQHLKLTCIRGNSITISIPRNQDRNDRNPSKILIRFLHIICRPLQIALVHY